MENQLTTQQEITPMEMIMAAVTNNADLDKVEKLLQLRERDDAFKARKAFAKDFAVAQANIIPVIKKKFNQQTKSKYEDLADIIETTQPIYTKEGFAVTFNEGDSTKDGHTRVLADVLHYLGHKEQYRLDVPLDGKGIKGNANMTDIHGKASAMQYGRRYLMRMIWNIPTADNDGNKPADLMITEKQLSTLLDLLAAKEIDEKELLKYLKIDNLDNLPEKDFMKAVSAINAAIKVKK